MYKFTFYIHFLCVFTTVRSKEEEKEVTGSLEAEISFSECLLSSERGSRSHNHNKNSWPLSGRGSRTTFKCQGGVVKCVKGHEEITDHFTERWFNLGIARSDIIKWFSPWFSILDCDIAWLVLIYYGIDCRPSLAQNVPECLSHCFNHGSPFLNW